MPIKIQDKTKCTGCFSCESVCPKECITMEADAEGFWYPLVEYDKCIHCELCTKKCPILNPREIDRKYETVSFAAINKDEKTRADSSSGGLFFAIAKSVINEKGVVFGASFSDDFSVQTKPVDAVDKLFCLQGSKYVQSKIGNSYKKAKMLLDDGQIVFFTGTPCQIGGLYAYLDKDYDNLLTADLICHGVPSPLVWKKYLDYRQMVVKSDILKISFRQKKYGWNKFSMYFGFQNDSEYLAEHDDDPFMKCFLGNYCLRPSCYDCKYKTEKRYADITLADFWGIESVYPEMFDDKGTSLIILHSSKGQKWIDSVSEKIRLREYPYKEIQKYNSAYLKSVDEPKERQYFFKKIEKQDFLTTYNALQKRIEKTSLRLQIRKDLKKRRYRRVLRKIKKLVVD